MPVQNNFIELLNKSNNVLAIMLFCAGLNIGILACMIFFIRSGFITRHLAHYTKTLPLVWHILYISAISAATTTKTLKIFFLNVFKMFFSPFCYPPVHDVPGHISRHWLSQWYATQTNRLQFCFMHLCCRNYTRHIPDLDSNTYKLGLYT